MSVPDLDYLLGRVRDLTQQYRNDTPESFEAFRELVQLLLQVTVLSGPVGVRLTVGPRGSDRKIVEGAAVVDQSVVRLNNGRYLRVSIVLYREPHEGGYRLKVEQASYQYQSDEAGNRWVFRYDYRREPTDQHPATHLQVRGTLVENVALYRGVLQRVHFPTGRVSLEAVIRLLIEQFNVPTNTALEVWRRVLAESERSFEEIAHRPLSGPSA